MKYILAPNVGLRSWHLVPWAYYIKGARNAKGLKQEEYELLRRCDGVQEIDESPLVISLQQRGFCRPANEDKQLSDWQREKICDNRYFPAIFLAASFSFIVLSSATTVFAFSRDAFLLSCAWIALSILATSFTLDFGTTPKTLR